MCVTKDLVIYWNDSDLDCFFSNLKLNVDWTTFTLKGLGTTNSYR